MTIALDLPTVLFVLQAAYLAGAMALAYARYRSADAAGAELIAVAFLVLACGAMIASQAEVDRDDYWRLSLINVTLGTLGYAIFFVGAVELSRRAPVRPFAIVLLPPILTLVLGLTTDFHATNWLRATVFNGTAALTMLGAAYVFYRDGRAEPLPGRRIVTLALGGAGLISLVMAVEFPLGTFWPSPVLAFVLILALMFAVALSVMILTMERAVVKLDRLAHTDMLTGLKNRRFFFSTVPASLGAGDAVVLFDADRFKKLNDRCGHAAGDEVLRAMAHALSAHLRDGDVLARYGGEEFILYLPSTAEACALAVANRMRAEVEATAIPGIHATISAGVAVAPHATTPLKHLIAAADTALYAAKAAGRNACRVSRGLERAVGVEVEVEVEPAA